MCRFFLGGICLVLAILPARNFFIDSEVQWSREGSHFSWRVMSKEVLNARLAFYDESNQILKGVYKKFTGRGFFMVMCDPYLLWRTAKFLCKTHRKIRAEASCQITTVPDKNKQIRGFLVHPRKNLCTVQYHPFRHNSWISKNPEEGKLWLDRFGYTISENTILKYMLQNNPYIKK